MLQNINFAISFSQSRVIGLQSCKKTTFFSDLGFFSFYLFYTDHPDSESLEIIILKNIYPFKGELRSNFLYRFFPFIFLSLMRGSQKYIFSELFLFNF